MLGPNLDPMVGQRVCMIVQMVGIKVAVQHKPGHARLGQDQDQRDTGPPTQRTGDPGAQTLE